MWMMKSCRMAAPVGKPFSLEGNFRVKSVSCSNVALTGKPFSLEVSFRGEALHARRQLPRGFYCPV
ncbi:hypothetical protein M6B38_322665 [Iris pallida]|uniref:Uncharacterized protein n=1 Tax=Iris pallida TaxID=29817 RepID=A0AAX6G4V1_IRIPA|nr:hypothetical protein M6B38_383210 [Iris pallida]KAJ6837889.1 hypothetical protein M6B38_322665 [Iris pallida]